MQRDEMELLAVRATLWRMEIEILREIHRYRFAKRGRRFGSDVELMIVYGAAIAHYGFGTPVRALPISRYLEMPRETVRRHMGRLVTLGFDLFAHRIGAALGNPAPFPQRGNFMASGYAQAASG